MERQSPFILLVEPDPFERLQLTRMLTGSGYRVTAVCEPDEALNVFVGHQRRIALVLWRARILGLAGDRLRDALHRIAFDIPILAVDEQSYGAYAGQCLDGASTVEEILAKVRRYVPGSTDTNARHAPPISSPDDVPEAWGFDDPMASRASCSPDGAFAWPMPDEELARIETSEQRTRRPYEYTDRTLDSALPEPSAPQPAMYVLATSATGPHRFQPVATQDLRDYIVGERKAHLARLRLLGGVSVTIVATCALTVLLFF